MKIAVLGHCFFTYAFIKEYQSLGGKIDYLCLPNIDTDTDPFANIFGAAPNYRNWLTFHRLYYAGWRQQLVELCKSSKTTIVTSDLPVSMMPKADILFVAGYCRRLPSRVLRSSFTKAYNIHPSLLPVYRGPQPEAQVILSGQQYTGVSIHLITDQFDAGPIFFQCKFSVPKNANVYDLEVLESKIAASGARTLVTNNIKPVLQKGPSSYYSNYDRNILEISKSISFEECCRRIRLRPEGYAYYRENGQIIFPLSIKRSKCFGSKNILLNDGEYYTHNWIQQNDNGFQEVSLD
jgi:hypothetical protein